MLFQKVSIPVPWRSFWFESLSNPPGNFGLASYFPLKVLTFETPLPLGIFVNVPWGGCGYILELHIAIKYWTRVFIFGKTSSLMYSFCFTFDSMQTLLNSISSGRIPDLKNLASSLSLNTWHLVRWNSSWRRRERVIIRHWMKRYQFWFTILQIKSLSFK